MKTLTTSGTISSDLKQGCFNIAICESQIMELNLKEIKSISLEPSYGITNTENFKITYYTGEIKPIFIEDIYKKKPLPKDHILAETEIDHTGRIKKELLPSFRAAIQQDYPNFNRGDDFERDGNIIRVPRIDSTWIEDEKKKQEEAWEEFKEKLRKDWAEEEKDKPRQLKKELDELFKKYL
jgi:hypothetical protein